MPAANKTADIHVEPLRRSRVKLKIIGETPLFQNRMANKAKEQLLVGGRKKTKADRAAIKHDPLEEYRSSAEIMQNGPTALGLRVVAVKAAMATAALETPGLTKSSVQRLVFMPGDHTPLYGIPQLRMDVTRSADIGRTPDVRTRCYLPRWGAEIDIAFVVPQLSVEAVTTLLCNAGVLIGIGDFRQEKGKGAFGAFRVVGDDNDPEWKELVANEGRAAQEIALREPEYANADTADLMAFYDDETRRRAA